MKKLLILFFVVLNLSILGREVDMEQLKAQNDIMYINGEKEAFTGIARTYFDNGNIKEEIEFKNGMKTGNFGRTKILLPSYGTYRRMHGRSTFLMMR